MMEVAIALLAGAVLILVALLLRRHRNLGPTPSREFTVEDSISEQLGQEARTRCERSGEVVIGAQRKSRRRLGAGPARCGWPRRAMPARRLERQHSGRQQRGGSDGLNSIGSAEATAPTSVG